MAKTNNPLVTSGGSKPQNVTGYIGEVCYFIDGGLRDNFVWADGSPVNATNYPQLVEYAEANNWAKNEAGEYLTPIIGGNVSGYGMNFALSAQIRAKLTPVLASMKSISENTIGEFQNGQILSQKNGHIYGLTTDDWAKSQWKQATITPANGITLTNQKCYYNMGLGLIQLSFTATFSDKTGPLTLATIGNIPLPSSNVVISDISMGSSSLTKTTLTFTTDGSITIPISDSATIIIVEAMFSMAGQGGEWPEFDAQKLIATFMSDGGSGKAGGIDILWENPDSTAEFLPQTINCNSESYDAIIVKTGFSDENATETMFQTIPTINQTNTKIRLFLQSEVGVTYRDVLYSETSLVFNQGYVVSNGATASVYNGIIPLTVYGVKIGSGGGEGQNTSGYVGEISYFADNILKDNHVWADGAPVDATQWPELAEYAATAGWAQNESGQYLTPDLRGRFLLGANESHTVGETGGEEKHTLIVAEMPEHSHTLKSISVQRTDNGANYFVGTNMAAGGIYAQYTTNTGNSQPFNIMPPYYTVAPQIRAKVDKITAGSIDPEELTKQILLAAHPIGSYYWSSESTEPSTLFGGTWENVTGTFLFAQDSEHPQGSTGGEEAHTLTVDEMPSHTHITSAIGNRPTKFTPTTATLGAQNNYLTWTADSDATSEILNSTTGNSVSHNNMPPYTSAYCWKRTS